MPPLIRRVILDLSLNALAGLALGVLTAYAQGWLGGDLNSLANSAGPWCLAAFALPLLTRCGPWASALDGALVLIMLELGYVFGSSLKNHPSAMSTIGFWLAAGVVVGPLLGLGAHWVRAGSGVRAALGVGLITGILIGEAAYSFARLNFPAFATLEIATAAALFTTLARRRLPVASLVGQAAAFTAAVASVLYLVYINA